MMIRGNEAVALYLLIFFFLIAGSGRHSAFSPEGEVRNSQLLSKVLSRLEKQYFRPLSAEERKAGTLEELFSRLDPETRLESFDPPSLDFVRGIGEENSIVPWGEPRPDLGYVKIAFWGRRTVRDFDRWIRKLARKKIQNLILDLRGNSGGHLESGIRAVERFVPPEKLLLRLRERDGLEIPRFSQSGERFSANLYVLTDQKTASTSEMVADALRRYAQAQLIGEPTQGKRSIQEVFLIDGSHILFVTVGYFSLPGESEIRKVEPDFLVPSESAFEKAVELAGGK